MLPAGIPAPDVEGRELYSLLLSHRERNSLPQSPLIPLYLWVSSQGREQMAGHSKDDLL